MKCPKCNFITSDYEQSCPKCKKSLAAVRKKINLPSYKANPPFLLTSLTAQNNGLDADILIDETESLLTEINPNAELDVHDFQAVEAMEAAFKDSQGLEGQPQSTPANVEKEPAENELSLSLEDVETKASEITFSLEELDSAKDVETDEFRLTDAEDDDLEIDLESLDLDFYEDEPEDKSS
jgi:hypothetical protein